MSSDYIISGAVGETAATVLSVIVLFDQIEYNRCVIYGADGRARIMRDHEDRLMIGEKHR